MNRKPWRAPTRTVGDTCPSAIGFRYQPVVVTTMSTVPLARSRMVWAVPDGNGDWYRFNSARYAQVFAQPPAGSAGSLSPRMYGSPVNRLRPGVEFFGAAYSNRPGFALAQASSSPAVAGGVGTRSGSYSISGPDG